MKNIVLIGMSGAGKSTIGKNISKRLDKEFLDTDDIIISNTKKNIDYIFKKYGEEFFRELEKLVINTLYKKKGIVISTGGGIVLNSINIEKLKNNGIIFFLKGSIETLIDNISSPKSSNVHRPLLDRNDLKTSLEEMYNIREDLYISSGDYIIEIDNKTIEEISDEIIHIYSENNSCS